MKQHCHKPCGKPSRGGALRHSACKTLQTTPPRVPRAAKGQGFAGIRAGAVCNAPRCPGSARGWTHGGASGAQVPGKTARIPPPLHPFRDPEKIAPQRCISVVSFRDIAKTGVTLCRELFKRTAEILLNGIPEPEKYAPELCLCNTARLFKTKSRSAPVPDAAFCPPFTDPALSRRGSAPAGRHPSV